MKSFFSKSKIILFSLIAGLFVFAIFSSSVEATHPSAAAIDVLIVDPGFGTATNFAARWDSSTLYLPLILVAPGTPTVNTAKISPSSLVSITDATLSSTTDVIVVPGRERGYVTSTTGFQDKIKTFVNNGGVLIIAPEVGFTTLTESVLGSFLASYSFDWKNVGCYQGPTLTIDSAHPLVLSPNPVTAPDIQNWGCTYHTVMDPSTVDTSTWQVVASTTGTNTALTISVTNAPVIATASFGSGGVIVIPQHFSHFQTGGFELIENSLVHASGTFGDTTPPVIATLVGVESDTNPTSGILNVGDTILFTATMGAEAAASVTGSYNGVALTWVTADSGATFTATYTVASGDADQASALPISGVTAKDAAGNTSAPKTGTGVTLGIDANPPVIATLVGVESDTNPTSGILNVGDTILFTATMDAEAAASVTGSYNGVALTWATADSGATFTATYTVASPGTDQASALQISGVTADDAAGNTSAPKTGTGVTLGIDSNRPSVTNVVVTPQATSPSITDANSGTNGNDAQSIEVTYGEEMDPTSTPSFAFINPAPAGSTFTHDTAASSWNSPTNTKYTAIFDVADNNEEFGVDSADDIDVKITGAKDVAGNTQNDKTEANKIEIDTKNPTVNKVFSTQSGPFMASATPIVLKIEWSEIVNVVSVATPTLDLDSSATAIATYNGVGSGTNTIEFDYTVLAGENSDDLDYDATNSLTLPNVSDSIKDRAGNDAVLTLATPGDPNSLSTSAAGDIIIDTTAPVISITINTGDAATVDRLVDLALTCDDTTGALSGSGCDVFKITQDVVTPTSFVNPVPATTTAVLLAPHNGKTVQLDIKDAAGNQSTDTDGIALDAEVTSVFVSDTTPKWLVDPVVITGVTKNPDFASNDDMTIAYGSPTIEGVLLNANADLDCNEDSAPGVRLTGNPFDGIADACYGADNLIKAGFSERINEETHNGVDDDGDGLIDEDTDSIFAWGTSNFYICPSEDLDANPHIPSATLVDAGNSNVQTNGLADVTKDGSPVEVQKHTNFGITFTIEDKVNRLGFVAPDLNNKYQFDYPVDTAVEYTDNEPFGTTNTCSFDGLTVTYTGDLIATDGAGTLSGVAPGTTAGATGSTADRLKVAGAGASVGSPKTLTVTIDTNSDYDFAGTEVSGTQEIIRHNVETFLNVQPPFVAGNPWAASGTFKDLDLVSDHVSETGPPTFDTTDTGDTDNLTIQFNAIISGSLGANIATPLGVIPPLSTTTTHSLTITDDNAVPNRQTITGATIIDEITGNPITLPNTVVTQVKFEVGAVFETPSKPIKLGFLVSNMLVSDDVIFRVTTSLGTSDEFLEPSAGIPDLNFLTVKCTGCAPGQGITQVEIIEIGVDEDGLGGGFVNTVDDFISVRSITFSYLDTEPSVVAQFEFADIFPLTVDGDGPSIHASGESLDVGKSFFHARAGSSTSFGSFNYEAEFIQNANYFGDTSDQRAYSTTSAGAAGSGTGVGGSSAQLTADAGVGFVSTACGTDSDKDSICNGWEIAGEIIYDKGLGVPGAWPLPDPPRWGVGVQTQPGPFVLKPDIIVEIDYMEDHEPSVSTLSKIRTVFETAALERPLGFPGTGINIHLELGDSIPHSSFLEVWTDDDSDRTNDFESIKADWFGKPSERPPITTNQFNDVTGVGTGDLTVATLRIGGEFTGTGLGMTIDVPSGTAQQTKGTMTLIADVTLDDTFDVDTGSINVIRHATTTNLQVIAGGITVTTFDPDPDGSKIQRFVVKVPFILKIANPGPFEFDTIEIPFSYDTAGPPDIVSAVASTAPHAPTVTTTLLNAKAQVTHYALVAHSIGTCGPTGVAEMNGNDLIISLGCGVGQAEELAKDIGPNLVNPVGGKTATKGWPMQFAGTFVHELGHNLGLNHGGPTRFLETDTINPESHVNCKPNYPSVMSYTRQLPTYLGSSGFPAQFSEGLLDDIDETSIVEGDDFPYPGTSATPITAAGQPRYTGMKMVVGHIGGSIGPFGGDVSVQSLLTTNSFIDWNGDGDTMDTGGFDVNNVDFIGDPCPASPGDTSLSDFDDWHNLAMDFRGATGASFDSQFFEPVGIGDEITPVNLDAALDDFDWYDGLLFYHTLDSLGNDVLTTGRAINLSFQLFNCPVVNEDLDNDGVADEDDTCIVTNFLVKQKDWYLDPINIDDPTDISNTDAVTLEVVTGKDIFVRIEKVDEEGHTGFEPFRTTLGPFHEHTDGLNAWYHLYWDTALDLIADDAGPGLYALTIVSLEGGVGIPLFDRNVDSNGVEIYQVSIPAHDFVTEDPLTGVVINTSPDGIDDLSSGDRTSVLISFLEPKVTSP